MVVTHAQEEKITGRVSLADKDGQVTSGDWLRVYSTKSAAKIPTVDLSGIDTPWERQSRINRGHVEFFLNLQRKMNEPGHAVENKLSRPDGTFAFTGLEGGRDYAVITFPTLIAGCKGAWQIAVDVVGGQNVPVELDNSNIVLPAYWRVG